MSDRDGGSMTPELDVRIQALEAEGRCTVAECVQVRSARWIGPEPTEAECACCMHEFESGDIDSSSRTGYWEILFDDDTDCHAEKIWLATGSRTDVSGDPLLQQLLAAHPIDMHRGLPRHRGDTTLGRGSASVRDGWAGVTAARSRCDKFSWWLARCRSHFS